MKIGKVDSSGRTSSTLTILALVSRPTSLQPLYTRQSLGRGRQKSNSPTGGGFQKWRPCLKTVWKRFTHSITLVWTHTQISNIIRRVKPCEERYNLVNSVTPVSDTGSECARHGQKNVHRCQTKGWLWEATRELDDALHSHLSRVRCDQGYCLIEDSFFLFLFTLEPRVE